MALSWNTTRFDESWSGDMPPDPLPLELPIIYESGDARVLVRQMGVIHEDETSEPYVGLYLRLQAYPHLINPTIGNGYLRIATRFIRPPTSNEEFSEAIGPADDLVGSIPTSPTWYYVGTDGRLMLLSRNSGQGPESIEPLLSERHNVSSESLLDEIEFYWQD